MVNKSQKTLKVNKGCKLAVSCTPILDCEEMLQMGTAEGDEEVLEKNTSISLSR